MGVSEGEEREKGSESVFKEIMVKIVSKSGGGVGNGHPDSRNTKNLK